MSFDAANKWLKSRVNVPTDMSSRELAIAPEFDARVRMHAFFSATVDKANVLDIVRERLTDVASGEMDLATARWRIKSALVTQGFSADDVGMTDAPPAGMDMETWKKRRAITNLASTRRLNLILTQNARMAWAIGRKEVSEDPDVMERWPNYRYIARGDARPTHAALDGLVLPKTDPFWHTHTPPWEFNCRCDIEDSDEAVAGSATTEENPDGSQTARVINPASGAAGIEIPPSPSGFVFRSDEPFAVFDMGRVRALELRSGVIDSCELFATRLMQPLGGTRYALPSPPAYAQNWEKNGLPAAERWLKMRSPQIVSPDEARSSLAGGFDVTGPDGRNVRFGNAVIDHWTERGKTAADIDGRLKHIEWAAETVRNPHEVWEQGGQRSYLQAFARRGPGYRGCLVAVREDGTVHTYFVQRVKELDKARKGNAVKVYGESKE